MNETSNTERLLSVKFPDIAREWDFSKNGELTPSDVTYGSNKKVYWICPICNESYPCTISNRTSKARKGCPYCCHNPRVNSKNNLAVQNPNLANEWDYSLNSLTPSEILPNSNKKYYWICPKCGMSYLATANNRSNGYACPYCASQKVCDFNCLATKYPDIAKEWHPSKNKKTPKEVTGSANQYAWWICKKGHEWKAKINNRTVLKRGCPECSKGNHTSVPEQLIFYYVHQLFSDAINNYKFNKTEIDIYIPSLKIGIEYDGEHFHRTKTKYQKDIAKNELLHNNGITLIRVRENGCYKMEAEKCIIYNCDFSSDYRYLQPIITNILDYLNAQANTSQTIIVNIESIINIIQASIKIIPFEKSFAAKHIDPAIEWDYSLNKPLIPEMFLPMSDKKVGWICKKCGYKWNAPIKSRSLGYGCPRCAERQQYTTEEWILKAKKIHGDKYDYSKVKYINSKTKITIKCLTCNMEFEQIPSDHLRGKGCKYCVGQSLHPLKTLAKLNPQIASEWDYEKNGTITPNDIGKSNKNKFWWKCNNGKNHSYLAYVQQRLRGSGCAVCAGRQIIPETSLAFLFPDLAKEWDYEKNRPLTPLDIGKGYDGDVWWKCPNNKHPSYMSKVYNRTKKGTGCKKCYEEKRKGNAP
jgi:hypothetical protein